MVKYSKDILREKRTINEAKLFCDNIFDSIDENEWQKFFLKKGKDRFYKDFWDEYYPLSIYSSLKYPRENYLIFLCEDGSKTDAEIITSDNHYVERIQITTASFDYNNALKNEKLLKDGYSIGVGKFKREKNNSISQSRGLRSEETALNEECNQIINAITKKIKNDTYENIDVLLVATESRFNNVIENYYKKLKNLLATQLIDKAILLNNKFKEIYLIDFSNKLIKL